VTTAHLPTGTQHDLVCGDTSATVVEVGGTLRRCAIGGVEVLDGFERSECGTDYRGQTLVPWPNRLRDGRYRFGGVEHQVPLSEPARGNALHGLVGWLPFGASRAGADRVTMRQVLPPQPGYPFALEVAIAYAVSDRGLTVTTTATNVGDADAPYGTGAHPYLRLGPGTIDGLTLQAPARSWLPSDERAIPDGRHLPVDGGPYDLRTPSPLAGRRLDTAFTDLDRDGDGRAWVELASPAEKLNVRLWMDERYPFLMLFTGDGLPDPARRRTGLAVEPMTCAPNAFQSGDGLVVLAPGGAHTASWGIEARPAT
jgi:aldose 1-epimerase